MDYTYICKDGYIEYTPGPGIYEFLLFEKDTFTSSFDFPEGRHSYSRFLKNKDIIE